MHALHVVQRSMVADGVKRLRGEVVDASGWRNVRPLVGSRFLLPFPEDAEPNACPCGRLWARLDDVGTCCGASASPAPERHPSQPKPPKPPAKKGWQAQARGTKR